MSELANLTVKSVKDANDFSSVGEIFAYLEKRGWKLLERNYRVKGGEIDIIAEKSDIIAFVEVKTRRLGTLVDGIDSIDTKKRQAIIRTADRYIEENPTDAGTIRFDVALVTITTEQVPRVIGLEYLEDAFDAFSI